MDFNYTDEQRMFSDALGHYLAEQYDLGTRQKIEIGDTGYAARAIGKSSRSSGLSPCCSRKRQAGLGGNAFDVQVVFDGVGRSLVTEPFLDTLMIGRALMAAGDTTRLESLIDGTTTGTLAHQEPGSHYEPTHVATRAKKEPRSGR